MRRLRGHPLRAERRRVVERPRQEGRVPRRRVPRLAEPRAREGRAPEHHRVAVVLVVRAALLAADGAEAEPIRPRSGRRS